MTTNQIIVALIGALAIILAAVITTWGVPLTSRSAQGQIESPKDGEIVSRAFRAKGTLSDIPTEKHVWIVVKIGNLLFPKEPELQASDQHWVEEFHEGGDPPNGKFSIILMMVGPRGNEEIKTWLNSVREGKNPPALENISDSSKLDTVRDLTLNP